MPTKQQLDKRSWEWVETVDPSNITNHHIETAYRIKLKSCKPNSCRRNCKGNPNCLVALGERSWMQDIADEEWHEIDDPNTERRQKDSYVGLKNLGATCYVNSFLQVWYHNPAFRKAVYQWNPNDDSQEIENKSDSQDSTFSPSSPIGHLQYIFALLQFSSRRYIDPSPFITCLGLNATQQQDAQEFSKLFIALLEDKLCDQDNPVVKRIIQEQYSGEYSYITRCEHCLTSSDKPSRFYELDLNIKGRKDLYECLDEFLQEEKLEGSNQYHCSFCQSKQNATRAIQLRHLPPVLNLQLLRFVYDRQTECKKKLNSFIRFPEVLDISKYMDKPENTVTYDLYGVLIHRGPSAYSGHYVAHIKDRVTGMWYKFNDETVEKMEGKKLHLGVEDNLGDSAGAPKSSKTPKLSKGHHATNNAYMLVYKSRNDNIEMAPDNSDEWDLPEHLQRAVAQDNSKFEDWVTELAVMREQTISTGKARQLEIRKLYEMLPVKEECPYEFISTDWLWKWLNGDSGKLSPVDNSQFLCFHEKLHPDKVPSIKCISIEAADEIYAKYGGGPRIRDALCRSCVESRCQLLQIKSRIYKENKIISTLLKQKITSENAFWISKSSLRNWRHLVMKQYEHLDDRKGNAADEPLDDRKGNASDEPSDDRRGNAADEPLDDRKGNTSATEETSEDDPQQNFNETGDCTEHQQCSYEEEQSDNSSMNFNEDILCEHNNMIADESVRRLIQTEAWDLLKKHFEGCPEFRSDSVICPICQVQRVQEEKTRDEHRNKAAEQKSCLPELYLDKCRPVLQKVEPNVPLYVINGEFVEEWRKFIRDSAKREPVTSVLNSTLLCEHDKLVFRPQVYPDGSSENNRIILLWEHEWKTVQNLFEVDVEISCYVIETGNDDRDVITLPALCESCHLARILKEQEQLFDFSSAKIYVRRVSKLDEEKANGVTETDALKINNPESSSSNDTGKEDPEFVQSVKKKKTDGGSESTLTVDLQLRRSSRRRRIRGEKELTVSCNQTLRDLKLQIMKLFNVPPYDQNLIMNGRPLVGEQCTLGSLYVLPESTILLKADEPTDESIVMDDYLKAAAPETGFKGTELLRS